MVMLLNQYCKPVSEKKVLCIKKFNYEFDVVIRARQRDVFRHLINLMHGVLRKTLCTTSSVSERGDMDSENHRPRSIGSQSVKSTVCKGYKPKTVHSVRERTDRGP